MDAENDIYFSIDFWYHIFRDNTVRTSFIPVSSGFVNYILADGVTLPQRQSYLHDDPRKEPNRQDQYDYSSEESDTAEETEEAEEYSFEELENEIQNVIDDFGGECFVRTNWSSAKDASWILGTLKCTTSGHVLLLLKSSDRISSDFKLLSDSSAVTPTLALQRWCNYHPSMEFCLYIADNRLIAISQRDTSVFYPFLLNQRSSICNLIANFVKERVINRFPRTHLAMDVYIDKKNKVWVVNLSPFDDTMNTALFSFEELQSLVTTQKEPVIRVVEEETATLPSEQIFYQIPLDMHSLGSAEEVASFINNLKKQWNVGYKQNKDD